MMMQFPLIQYLLIKLEYKVFLLDLVLLQMHDDNLHNFVKDHTTIKIIQNFIKFKILKINLTSLYIANSPFLCDDIPPHADPKCLIAGKSMIISKN